MSLASWFPAIPWFDWYNSWKSVEPWIEEWCLRVVPAGDIFLLFCREWPVTKEPMALWIALLGCIYIRVKAKVIYFFDLLPLTHRCSVNTQIGNNATDRKRRRFRFCSNINAPLRHNHTKGQAASQAARSHWNTLWSSKMGPRSIPKHHGKRQNFKAAAWPLTLGAFTPSDYVTVTITLKGGTFEHQGCRPSMLQWP